MKSERTQLQLMYLTAFVLRFMTGMTAWIITKQFGLPLVEDAEYYQSVGAFVAEDWMSGRSSIWLHTALSTGQQAWLMVWLVAVFYFITAGIRALPILLAIYCAVTAVAPIYTYRIARQLGSSHSSAMIGAWIVTLSPGFLIWSGALYKEGLILVVLNAAVFHAMMLQEKWRLRSILAIALSLPAIYGLRFYLAFFMAAALGIALMFGKPAGNHPGAKLAAFAKQFSLVALLAGAVFATGFDRLLQRSLPTSLDDALEHVQRSRVELSEERSGYLRTLSVASPKEAIQALPVGFAYFMTVPLPWQTGSLRQDIAIPETLLWILLYPVIAIGIAAAWRTNRRGTLLIVSMAVVISLFYALFIGNIGTAYRLRIQVWLLLAVFIGWGWDRVRGRKVTPAALYAGL